MDLTYFFRFLSRSRRKKITEMEISHQQYEYSEGKSFSYGIFTRLHRNAVGS
jgi:hypothetical protein